MLVDHPDARRDGVLGPGEHHGPVVDQDLALVGLQQAVQGVHQRRLAGAVLPEQGVDLPGLDGEIDVVVGQKCAEPLRDTAKFESHAMPSGRPRIVLAQLVGWLGEVILIDPLMMPCLTWASSDWSDDGTFDWKSWYGASPTPLLERVPM